MEYHRHHQPVIVREIALEDTNRMPIKIRLFPRCDRQYSADAQTGGKHRIEADVAAAADDNVSKTRLLSTTADDIDNHCDVAEKDSYWERSPNMANVRTRVRFADVASSSSSSISGDREAAGAARGGGGRHLRRPGAGGVADGEAGSVEVRKSDSQFINSAHALSLRAAGGGGEGRGRVPLNLHNQRFSAFELKEMESYSEIHFVGDKSANASESPALEVPRREGEFDDAEGFYIPVIHDQIAYRYEILKVMGKGSFGQVVKAFDHKYGLCVAVKIIRNTDERFRRQAEEEIGILKTLNAEDSEDRANIVRMLDHFVFRDHHCLVFELLSLDFYEMSRLNKFRGMSLQAIHKPTLAILRCLELLHRHRIVHCDLKPENILFRRPGRSAIKVIDFGSSCFEHDQPLTYVQSRFYRSPETILGAGFGCPSDMWSLGCILVEMVTGRPLFAGEDEVDQLTCMMECLGMPSRRLLARSKRARQFFSSTTGYPRYCNVLMCPDGRIRLGGCVTRRGRRRGPPGSRDLGQVLQAVRDSSNSFPSFLHFIKRCLEWDPQLRMTPEQGLKHEFVSELQ